jgi:hypothetical protein
MYSTKLAKLSLMAAFALAAIAQAGSVLINGDFQTGSLSPWTPFTTSNGTNGSGLPNVVSFDTTGMGASLAAHFNVGAISFDGTQQGGGIQQTFNLSSGGMFNFFANIASQDDADGQINSDAGTFSIFVDSTLLASDFLGGFSSPLQILRGELSGSVDLSAGDHTMEILITRQFLSNGTATPDEYVDNISLSSNSTVPEPATFGTLGIAIAAVALYRRRRSA